MDNTTVSTAGRSYDTFGRIASISNGTDTLSYTYRPGGQMSLSGWTNGQRQLLKNLTKRDARELQKLTKEIAKQKGMPRGVVMETTTKAQAKKLAKRKGYKVIHEVDKKTNVPHFHSAKNGERTAVHYTWTNKCYGIIVYIPIASDIIEANELFMATGNYLAEQFFKGIEDRLRSSIIGEYIDTIEDNLY